MSILIIDDNIRKKIREIISYSELNVINAEEPELVENAGGNPNHTIYLPFGIKCVYSHEKQRGLLFRHFSISVYQKNHYPHPAAVQMMLEEFKFRNRVRNHKLIIWKDEVYEAINCLETLNEDDEDKLFKKISDHGLVVM